MLEGCEPGEVTFLHKLDCNKEAAEIAFGEHSHLAGLRGLFFKLLDRSISMTENGRGYRFQRGGVTHSGKLLHHNVPSSEELGAWDRACGGRQRYIEDCGESRSWVYCRQYGVVSVQGGGHQLFMSYLRFKLTGQEELYASSVTGGCFKWADEFLELPGTAFNSSVGGNHVVAVEGNLTPEEVSTFEAGGYEVRYVKKQSKGAVS